MPDRPSAADILARRLAEAGCRQAFGMPGGEVLTLVDAFARAGIETVLARHETAAGFMAEGAWHATGAPGVLLATLGPGAMSAVNAVANAGQDRVPLLVITGCVDEAEAATYTHQVLDHARVFRAIAKASLRLVPEAAGVLADRAVATAIEGRPGPVHLDVPISVAAAPVEAVWSRPRPAATVPAADAVEIARSWLGGASRPLILAGLDAVNEGAGPSLRALAERLGAPVVTTYKGKGLIPEDHPLAMGGAGLSPLADGHLLPLVARARRDPARGLRPDRDARGLARSLGPESRSRDRGLRRARPQRDAPRGPLDRREPARDADAADEWRVRACDLGRGRAGGRPSGAPPRPSTRARVGGPPPWWRSAAGHSPTTRWRPSIRARTGSCCRRCGERRCRGGCCSRRGCARWARRCPLAPGAPRGGA